MVKDFAPSPGFSCFTQEKCINALQIHGLLRGNGVCNGKENSGSVTQRGGGPVVSSNPAWSCLSPKIPKIKYMSHCEI